MNKWNTAGQRVSGNVVVDQRNSIETQTSYAKKFPQERLSCKGYLYRRSATEPNEGGEPSWASILSKKNGYKCYSGKVKMPERLETNYRFLTGKKSQKPFKQTNSNIHTINDSGSFEAQNRFSFNDYEWQSKVYGAGVPAPSGSEAKWKKNRLKQDQTFHKLKQIQNFLHDRRRDSKAEEQPERKYAQMRCGTQERETTSNFFAKTEAKAVKRESGSELKTQFVIRGKERKSIEQNCSLVINMTEPDKKTKQNNLMQEEPGRKFFPRKSKNYFQINIRPTTKLANPTPPTLGTSQIHQKQLQILNKIGAGTFGEVYTSKDPKTGQLFAVKKIHNDKTHKNREIEIMDIINSPFVIKKLKSYSTYTQDSEGIEQQYIHIVMPQYDGNLYQHFRKTYYGISQDIFKLYMYQIFRGIFYLHSRGVCHRDLKPQNILIKDNRIVICDLGSAKILKQDESNISYICSRCYRAPQLIFGQTHYTVSIDIWSAGCVILEFLNKGPLFIGKDSLHHLIEVIKVLGTPSQNDIYCMNPSYDSSSFKMPKIKTKKWSSLFPTMDPLLEDLLNKIMIYDPSKRLSAGEVLCHPYFSDIRDHEFLEKLSLRHEVNYDGFFLFDERQIGLLKNPHRLIPLWFVG